MWWSSLDEDVNRFDFAVSNTLVVKISAQNGALGVMKGARLMTYIRSEGLSADNFSPRTVTPITIIEPANGAPSWNRCP